MCTSRLELSGLGRYDPSRWKTIAAKEHKKRKRKSSGSPDPKVKIKKRTANQTLKPKKNTESRVLDPYFLYRLRYESEDDYIFVSHRSHPVVEQATTGEKATRSSLFLFERPKLRWRLRPLNKLLLP